MTDVDLVVFDVVSMRQGDSSIKGAVSLYGAAVLDIVASRGGCHGVKVVVCCDMSAIGCECCMFVSDSWDMCSDMSIIECVDGSNSGECMSSY